MTENQIKLTTIIRKLYDDDYANEKKVSQFKEYKKDVMSRLKELNNAHGINLEPLMDKGVGTYVVEKNDEEFWTYILKNLTSSIFLKRRKPQRHDKLTYEEIIKEGEMLEGIVQRSGATEKEKHETINKIKYMTGYTLIRKAKSTDEQAKKITDDICDDILGRSGYTVRTSKPKSHTTIDPDNENFDLEKLMDESEPQSELHYYDAEALLDFYITLLRKSEEIFHGIVDVVCQLRADEELDISKASTPEEILALATRELQRKRGISLI